MIQLKQIRQGQNTQAEIDESKPIEYDVKSYQVKMTIVKCTKIRLKGLKGFTTHRKTCWYRQHIWYAIIYF